jgi:hypothetical protein
MLELESTTARDVDDEGHVPPGAGASWPD